MHLAAALFLLSAGFLIGCGGDDGGGDAQCASVTGCGGDIVGTWEVKDSCAYGNFLGDMDAMCQEAKLDMSGLRVTGSQTFLANKTYSTSMAVNGTMKMTLPSTCLADEDEEDISCKQFSDVYGALLVLAGDNTISLKCTGTATCVCTFTFNDAKSEDQGTYALNGNTVTEQSSDEDEEPTTSTYCAEGNTLSLSEMTDVPNRLTFARK